MTEQIIPASKLTDELTAIKYRLTMAEDFSKDWHNNILKWRNLYNFKHYDSQPKPGETQFADPTYTNTVDLAVGILQANEMIWKATGWSPSTVEQKKSDKIEKYISGVMDINNARNQYDIRYEVITHFVRDGGAVVYVLWDTEIGNRVAQVRTIADRDYGSVTKRVYTETPVIVKVFDPLNIHVLPGGPNRWAAVCYTEQRTVYDIESIYSVKLKNFAHMDMSQKMQTKGKFVDYWDIAYELTEGVEPVSSEIASNPVVAEAVRRELVVRNAVLFDDEFISPLEVKRGYKTFPYKIGFYKPTDRMRSAGWQNVLSPLVSTVESLEKAINRRQRQIDMFSSLPMLLRTVTGRTLDLDPGMGNVLPISSEEDLAFPQWPGNPPDVDRQIEYLRARVQQSGFSDVMYGAGGNQLSGFALSQLGDQNRIRLEQPVVHLEQLWAGVGVSILDLTDTFAANDAIQVCGTVKGRGFAEIILGSEVGGYHLECEIRPEFPNENVRKHAMATQVKGILAESTIMEKYLGIQQPSDERMKRLMEMAQQNPVAMQFAILAALKEMAEGGDEIAQQTYDVMSATLQQQQGVAGGRNPEQPLGLQSPTGQPGAQVMGNPLPGRSLPEEVQKQGTARPNMAGGV